MLFYQDKSKRLFVYYLGRLIHPDGSLSKFNHTDYHLTPAMNPVCHPNSFEQYHKKSNLKKDKRKERRIHRHDSYHQLCRRLA